MKSQFTELFWFFCMMSFNEIIIFLEKSCFSEFLMQCVIMLDLFLSYIIYWFYLLWFPILIFVNFLLFKRSFKSSFWLNISSFVIKTYLYILGKNMLFIDLMVYIKLFNHLWFTSNHLFNGSDNIQHPFYQD